MNGREWYLWHFKLFIGRILYSPVDVAGIIYCSFSTQYSIYFVESIVIYSVVISFRYIYIYIYISVCVYIHIYTYINTYIYTRVYIYIYIYTHVCVCVCVCVCVNQANILGINFLHLYR